MSEKRVHSRVAADGEAKVGGAKATLKDVSAGGMGAEVTRRVEAGELSVGDRVLVEFDLDTSRVETEAEVVRYGDGRVGVRFLSLDPKSLAAIATYLARELD